MPAKARKLDFTNVKERKFTKRHVTAGDYKATVTDVEDAKSKSDGGAMWLFTIRIDGVGEATYPYYCKLDADNLWKVKTLFGCAGLKVPKSLVKMDPNRVIDREIGVTMDDTEYNGRMQSEVASVIPADEVEANADEEEADTEDEEEEEEEAPKAKKKSKKDKKGKGKKKSAEVDDDELEELEVEEI